MVRHKGDEAAFPSTAESFEGLTKREYMATHILAGMVAMDSRTSNMDEQARTAVRRTDALIATLNGPETPE